MSDVLVQIDAYQPPKGVDAARFATLKTELKRLLIARAESGGRGSDRAATQAQADRIFGKTISIAPVDPINQVTDLAATVNPAGTQATLTWTELLPGDYDNNGVVDIGDLIPLALYYGQRTDSGPDDGHKLVVGDGDPEIGVGDIKAIANNYAVRIQGYRVYRGADDGLGNVTWEVSPRPNIDPVNPQWSVNRPGVPPVSTRPTYTYLDDISSIADKANLRFEVAPFGDGGEGSESNVAVMPAPPTFSVSGIVYWLTGTLAGATMTLTPGGLTATTAADGTFTMTSVANGSYTITPSKPGYAFEPADRAVTVAGADITALGFRGTAGLADSPWPKFHAGATNAGSSAYVGTQAAVQRWGLPTYAEVDSSPALAADGTVFVGSAYNGTIYAVSRDGTLKWTYSTGGPVKSSPAVAADSVVYVGSDDKNVYAINSDETLRWKYLTGGAVRSSPTVGSDGTIYIGSGDHNVYALNPDGSLVWQYATGGAVDSSPALSAGAVYIGSSDGYVYALDTATGSLLWRSVTSGINSSPAISGDGTIFVGGGSGVYALRSLDGSTKWLYPASGQVRSSPAIGPDGTVYVAADFYVYSLNPADGSLWWRHLISLMGGSESSPAVGADRTVYIGADDGYIYALEPTQGDVKWSYRTGGAVKSSPAIGGDGTVYVGERMGLVALGSGRPSVHGTVAFSTGSPLEGVLLTLMPGPYTTTSGSDGSYAILDVPSGTYTLTPLKWGYLFSPPNMLVHVSTDDVIDRDFTATLAPTHKVSGQVTFEGNPFPGVTMTFMPGGYTIISGSNGTYSMNVASGTYSIVASKTGYAFAPTPQTAIVSGQDVSGKDFSATPTVTYSVSGTVTSGGNPVEGAALNIMPGRYSSTTGADGTYTITGVSDGRYYVLTPTSNSYWFTPPQRWFAMNSSDVSGMDFFATPGGLADSPWPKFHGNERNTGLSPYVGAQTGAVRWSFTTGVPVNSSPTIGPDGTIYVGASNGVYALNSADGSQKWKIASTVQCSPAVTAYGMVYAYTTSGLSALRSADGGVLWTRAMGGTGFPAPFIAIGSGTIYIAGALSGQYYVFALFPADGSIKWQVTFGSEMTSCPAIGSDGTVYVAGVNGYTYALDPLDGSVKWSYRTNAAMYSSPAVGADGTVYVGSANGSLVALSPVDGSLKWRADLHGSVRSSPAVGADGTVYVGSWYFAGALFALNQVDGSVKWQYYTSGVPNSSPAVDSAGSVYFGGDDYMVYALNSDGTLKWTYKTSAPVNSSPAIGADGTVYIGSDDGKLYAFGP